MKGFFACEPDKYACIGVKEPFVIGDLNVECPVYPEYRKQVTKHEVKTLRLDGKTYDPYVGDDGIYCPIAIGNSIYYQRIIPKDLFVEAYNRWIKGESNTFNNPFSGQDDADDWCD